MKQLMIFGLLLLSVTFLNAQEKLVVETEKSSITIEGTSTLHEWDIEVEEFNGYAEIESNSEEIQINGGRVVCEVASFESGKGRMNKEVYKAMKSEDYPEVTFNYVRTEDFVRNNNKLSVNAIGELTIAGTTRTINTTITGEYREGVLKLEGTEHFKMSSYGVEPPSVMFGTIKTGDKISIKYSFIFK
jgi:polyisoprenoid-binding protein YceI